MKKITNQNKISLATKTFATKLGDMVAIGCEKKIYLLEFTDRKKLNLQIENVYKKFNFEIKNKTSQSIDTIEKELKNYFNGNTKNFTTPYEYSGTDFQKLIWNELKKISYGQKISYKQLAQRAGKPTAYRAVANANGANKLAIIIPCHRVINSNGAICGYGGGVSKKIWLLKHEQEMSE